MTPIEVSFTLSPMAAARLLALKRKNDGLSPRNIHSMIEQALLVWASDRRFQLRFSRVDPAVPGISEAGEFLKCLRLVIDTRHMAAATVDSLRWRAKVLSDWLKVDIVTAVGALEENP
jgi:hypothetical protein